MRHRRSPLFVAALAVIALTATPLAAAGDTGIIGKALSQASDIVKGLTGSVTEPTAPATDVLGPVTEAFGPQRAHAHKDEPSAAAAEVPTERLADVACTGGTAGPFPCAGVDLLSFVPLGTFQGDDSAALLGGGASDLWGWTDPVNGDEYVLLGKTNGTAFFRVTDPTDPVYLGDLPNSALVPQVWHDIKVYADHAFIVSESIPHGMRVFDLRRLRGVTTPQVWTEDASYPLASSAHNIAINTDTGFAYVVGGNIATVVPDPCLSGLHIIDIRTPTAPAFAGCGGQGDGPGTLARTLGEPLTSLSPFSYVHDTQCVLYRGPDLDYRGREICLNSSENSVEIVDVTDKGAPVRVSSLTYPQTGYTHQGWLTEDQRYFLFGDELDELDFDLPTRTLIADVSDLDNPTLTGQYLHPNAAIDHNMYTRDGLVFQSNYTSGLRVLSTARVAQGTLDPVAFFDTFPADDDAGFSGTWSNYPYFDSGTIAVSGREEGLFLVRLQPGVGSGS